MAHLKNKHDKTSPRKALPTFDWPRRADMRKDHRWGRVPAEVDGADDDSWKRGLAQDTCPARLRRGRNRCGRSCAALGARGGALASWWAACVARCCFSWRRGRRRAMIKYKFREHPYEVVPHRVGDGADD